MRRLAVASSLALLSACVTLDLRTPPPSRAAAAPEYRAPPSEPVAPAAPPSYAFRCPHPMPATAGGGLCAIPVVHEHPFPPDPAYEPGPDGSCAGAPTSFSYQGAHPVPAGGWCHLAVLHVHDFAPLADLAWTSPSPGVFVFAGPPPAAPPPAAVVVPVGVERTVEAIETVGATVEAVEEVAEKVGKAAKVVGKVGKVVGKGAATYLKGFVRKPGDPEPSKSSRSSGHHHGGHGGGHH